VVGSAIGTNNFHWVFESVFKDHVIHKLLIQQLTRMEGTTEAPDQDGVPVLPEGLQEDG
jgi:hypothetical protein